MTNDLDSKRLSDDELEAVSGGVTPPTIDPSALAGLMHSQVSTALTGGGAYPIDTHAPAHTDIGTPTVTDQTHTTVSGASLFGGGSVAAPDSHLIAVSSVPPPMTATGTTSGPLHIDIPASVLTPPRIDVTTMHFDSQQLPFTKVTPTVVGESDHPALVGGTSSVNYGGTMKDPNNHD